MASGSHKICKQIHVIVQCFEFLEFFFLINNVGKLEIINIEHFQNPVKSSMRKYTYLKYMYHYSFSN